MYLWKLWRDARWIIAAGGGYLALILWATWNRSVHIHSSVSVSGSEVNFPGDITLSLHFLSHVILLGFMAWVLGTQGPGRDIHNNSGSYLFSLPRSRASFIWSSWSIGFMSFTVLLAALTANMWLDFSYNGTPHLTYFHSYAVSLILNALCAWLAIGLVFGLTFLATTVLCSPGGGMMTTLGFFVVYTVLMNMPGLRNIPLPQLIIVPYSLQSITAISIAPHLAIKLISRALLVIAFPVAAQLYLKKADIVKK